MRFLALVKFGLTMQTSLKVFPSKPARYASVMTSLISS